MAKTNSDFLGVIVADLQHPPELLPELLDPVLNGGDVAIASRYVTGKGDSLGEWNKFRVFVSRCSTLLATATLRGCGLKVTDPLSGFFVVSRQCADNLKLQPTG